MKKSATISLAIDGKKIRARERIIRYNRNSLSERQTRPKSGCTRSASFS